MQVQHATCNWKCAHMHESSSWDCAFCSKSVVIYKVVNVSSLLSPSLSRRQSRSLLPSVTFETNQHLRSIAAIKQKGQIFCILFKTGRSPCFKCERNEMIRDGGLCPLNPDCVAIHSLLDLPFTGSYLNFMSDHCLALSVIHSFCKCPTLLMNKIGYLFGDATFAVDCLFQLSKVSTACISCRSCWLLTASKCCHSCQRLVKAAKGAGSWKS